MMGMNMFKFYKISGCFFLVSTLFVCSSHASSRDGIYAGLSLGGVRDSYEFAISNSVISSAVRTNLEKEHFLGGIFLGYGETNDIGFYLAGEVGTYPLHRSVFFTTSLLSSVNIYTFNQKLSVQDYLTIEALPGYRFNESLLLYGRAGLAISQFNLSQQANTGFPLEDNSSTKLGGRIGTGVNYSLSYNLGLGLDFIHTAYQEMKTFNYGNNYKQNLSSNYVGFNLSYTL
jgi:outer membrane immunogenic protein